MCGRKGGIDDVWGGGRRGEEEVGVKACTLFECLSESRWAASSNRVHSEVTTTSLRDRTWDVDQFVLCIPITYQPVVCRDLCTQHAPECSHINHLCGCQGQTRKV